MRDGTVLGSKEEPVGGREGFPRTNGRRGMGVAVAFRSRSDCSNLACLVWESPREVEEKEG